MTDFNKMADDLERLCCAETEGKFFDYVTDSIGTIIAGLRQVGEARRNAIEECATAALEQRCERETPWDLACATIAEKIRALANSSQLQAKTFDHVGSPRGQT